MSITATVVAEAETPSTTLGLTMATPTAMMIITTTIITMTMTLPPRTPTEVFTIIPCSMGIEPFSILRTRPTMLRVARVEVRAKAKEAKAPLRKARARAREATERAARAKVRARARAEVAEVASMAREECGIKIMTHIIITDTLATGIAKPMVKTTVKDYDEEKDSCNYTAA
jgi:uncharacterized protein YqfA (UPF0365 family)